jgi:hypothetical protein
VWVPATNVRLNMQFLTAYELESLSWKTNLLTSVKRSQETVGARRIKLEGRCIVAENGGENALKVKPSQTRPWRCADVKVQMDLSSREWLAVDGPQLAKQACSVEQVVKN